MRILIIILVACLVTACARPVGDLGRAKPSVLHDEVMPTAGKLRAMIFQEPVSNFNQTDEEVEMHDRAWRVLIAPHSKDWFFDILVEWQRTRLIPPVDAKLTYDRYYAVLRSERYRSSRVRYSRVISDIETDIATMPGVFKSICAVQEIDRRRRTAASSLTGADTEQREHVYARRYENDAYIAWFVRAARYRYDSYSFALESLLVETPHEEAREIDRRLSELAILVERAERHDFCNGAENLYGGDGGPAFPAPRMKSKPFTPEPSFRK